MRPGKKSAEEISRVSRLRKSYILKLQKAYQDKARGFPFGINLPKSKRRPKKKQPEKVVRPRWHNQTDLSRRLGLSPVIIDKRLIEAGLIDPLNGQATKKAIEEDYARIVYKRTRGRRADWHGNIAAYYIWNVEKVLPLLTL